MLSINPTAPPSITPQNKPSSYCKTVAGQWVKVVRSMIRDLGHGEVQLTVKDGEVVEVRKLEKIRFEHHLPHRKN